MPSEEKPKEPIETWVMTRSDDAKGDFYSMMSGLGGSTKEVDPYYTREIEVHGEVRTIRGRLLLTISSPKEREDMLDRLARTEKKVGLRRVTDEELAAIAEVERHAYTGPGGTTWYPTVEERKKKKQAEAAPPLPPPLPSVALAKEGPPPPVSPEPDEEELSRLESEGGIPG